MNHLYWIIPLVVFIAWLVLKCMRLKGGMEATTKQYNARNTVYPAKITKTEFSVDGETFIELPNEPFKSIHQLESEQHAKNARPIQDCQCEQCQTLWKMGLPKTESEQHGEKQ